MSDWELLPTELGDNHGQSKQPMMAQSDWGAVEELPNSLQPQNESLGQAVLKIPGRVGEDIYRRAMGFIKNVPGYWESSKTEVPGFFYPRHPLERTSQTLAGLTEAGHNALNIPRVAAEYAANRLNLIPKSWAEKVPYQKDISSNINQLFGQAQHPGSALARGIGRNAFNLYGTKIASPFVNPKNLTAKNIAKNVLKAEEKQVASHSKRYNKIWDEAEKSGFNQVPANQQLLSDNLSIIEKYKTPREYQSLENFILKPTLENAQKAQSDMGVMHRKLEEKSRSGSLTSEEQSLYKAAKNSENHIENNMFKNKHGNINNALQDKYKKVTNSYRENVVPYKYNENIQKYKAKEMLPNELVNSLSRGEFAAKKGSKHPAIKIRNALPTIGKGTGALGGIGWLINEMFGNQPLE